MAEDIEQLLEIARSGDLSARADLAGRSGGVPIEVERVLADDPRPEIVWLLVQNYATSRDVLVEIAGRSDELREMVSQNVNAPPYLKEQVPLAIHAQVAVEVYLREMGATREQWLTLIYRHVDGDETLLGEAWRQVSARSS
jgi:hypothetical protein